MQNYVKQEQSGKTTVIAMIVTLGLVGAYTLFGKAYLEAEFPEIINQIVMAILGVLATFSIGCGLHLALVGDRSQNDVRKDLRNRLIEYGDFVDFASEKIKEFENSSRFHIHAIMPVGLDSLYTARRIVQALALRVNQINSLLNSGNTMDLIEAEELITRELELSENCVETLIGSNPIPPIEIDQCIKRVSSLLDRVSVEIDRLQLAA